MKADTKHIKVIAAVIAYIVLTMALTWAFITHLIPMVGFLVAMVM